MLLVAISMLGVVPAAAMVSDGQMVGAFTDKSGDAGSRGAIADIVRVEVFWSQTELEIEVIPAKNSSEEGRTFFVEVFGPNKGVHVTQTGEGRATYQGGVDCDIDMIDRGFLVTFWVSHTCYDGEVVDIAVATIGRSGFDDVAPDTAPYKLDLRNRPLPAENRPSSSESLVQGAIDLVRAGQPDGWLRDHGIVLARHDRFPDALAGSTMALERDGRNVVLFTTPDRLSLEVAKFLRESVNDVDGTLRYGLVPVMLLGGVNAISDRVIADLRAISPSFDVRRVSGSDRVATSVAIADAAFAAANPDQSCPRVSDATRPVCGAQFWDEDGTAQYDNPYWFDRATSPFDWSRRFSVVLARSHGAAADSNGTSAWADSAAVAPYTRTGNLLVLLTETGKLDQRVANWLKAHKTQISGTVFLAGGPGALSEQVAVSVKALGFTPARLAGTERTATARVLADRFAPVHRFHANRVDILDASGWPVPRQAVAVNGWAATGWGWAISSLNLVNDPKHVRPLVWTRNGSESSPRLVDCLGNWRYHVALLGGPNTLPNSALERLRVQPPSTACTQRQWMASWRGALDFCDGQKVRLAVNYRNAPAGAASIVAAAVRTLNAAVPGLTFVEDTTNAAARTSDDADSVALAASREVRSRTSSLDATIAVVWPDRWDVQGAVGIGGGVTISGRSGNAGHAHLDRSITGATLSRVLLHEIGHAVGLDHVTGQQMMRQNGSVDTYQAGDIEGLRYFLDRKEHC